MPVDDLEDTQPSVPPHETRPNPPSPEKQKRFPRWLVALCMLLLLAIGLLGGYDSGMTKRYAAQGTVAAGQLSEQFQLGSTALAAGNYELAKQYFEGVLRTNPNYPGIQAAYTDLLVRMQVNTTPQDTPTPAFSPTPDLRSADQIFATANQLLNSSDWNGAITNLDSLRKSFPTYHTAQVDGMYYMALRQSGIAQITAGCQNVNLEGGIYDLTLAEQFVGTGNLDSIAESLRTYARLYIIAASFWDQDWVQAQNIFAQVITGYPNMADGSCLTANQRWAEATVHVADQLMAKGDSCGAETQYADAFKVNDSQNATAYPDATQAADKCNGSKPATKTPTLAGTPSETLAETPTGGLVDTPTDTPQEAPTDTPTPKHSKAPTATPTCDASSGTPCP
jgi:tetratricopeptide (TPR) repeat protein